MKTVDTKSKGWFSRMKKHIVALGKSQLMVSHRPAKIKLDIRVQPAGLNIKKAKELKDIGEIEGVLVEISEF